MTSTTQAMDSYLALDISETYTRALLFDIVGNSYRFVAAGNAQTTLGTVLQNVSTGARLAIEDLSRISGRTLIGRDNQLLIPTGSDGSGVDALVVVVSAGSPLKVVIAGLLEDVSLESARRLAETTSSVVLDTFSLNDRRKTEERLDALLHLRPDLVLVAGGTEGGAGQSITQLLEPVLLACQLLPQDARPRLLYAGNRSLGERVEAIFTGRTQVNITPNIRPALEVEQLEPAHVHLARLYRELAIQKLPGLQELDLWASSNVVPRPTGFGRVIRFLSLEDATKGVLGVDLGVNATTMVLATGGKTSLGVYPDYGLGKFTAIARDNVHLQQVLKWLPLPIPEDYVQDYIVSKTLHPGAVPTTAEDLAVEQALARYLMQLSWDRLSQGVVNGRGQRAARLLPPVEPIIAAGRALTHAPTSGQSMLMLLDALQPVGITTLILDRNNLSPILGAAASLNPALTVQVLDSGTFTNLGTVICPVGNARPGTPILRVQMTLKDSDEEIKLDVKQGSLEVLPLAQGQVASLHLSPFHRADIGMGPGKGGSLKRVVGGVLGVVIDARGRPLQLSEDTARRQELFRKWLWNLGG
jgi:hypothetical protein